MNYAMYSVLPLFNFVPLQWLISLRFLSAARSSYCWNKSKDGQWLCLSPLCLSGTLNGVSPTPVGRFFVLRRPGPLARQFGRPDQLSQ